MGTLFFSSYALGVSPASSEDFPIVIEVTDGLNVDVLRLADHRSSLAGGNWIELVGGNALTLPDVTVNINVVSDASTTEGGITINVDSFATSKTVVYPFGTHSYYDGPANIQATFHGATTINGYTVEWRLIPATVDDFITAFEGAIGGVVKPDPGIYEHCLNKIGVPPHECLFVDDSIANVDGAKRCELNDIHFRSYSQFVEELEGNYSLSDV